MEDLTLLTVKELYNGYKNKAFSVQEVSKAYFKKILKTDDEFNSYITVCENKCASTPSNSNLYGIPYSVKDNILTKGVLTTCASKQLSDFIPPYNASVCQKLDCCGSILLGKTNLDEFAMGNSTENSAIKITKNPANTLYIPGGSSGGSAASVAANQAAFSLGSDTGGSVCQPASFCGVVGLKPTYGLVSRRGLIGFAPSLDQIGILSKTVYDSAMVLSEIAFKDENDSTSLRKAQKDYTTKIQSGIKGMKVGIISEFISDGADAQVLEAVKKTANIFEKLGAKVKQVSMPLLNYGLMSYIVISSAEAFSTLSRYDGIKYGFSIDSENFLNSFYTKNRSMGFGSEVKRRILSGSVFLSKENFEKYYLKAQKARLAIIECYNKTFEKYDILLSPVSPTPATKLGSSSANPIKRLSGDRYTCCANLAYLPSLSVPFCKDSLGLPIGVLLTAPKFCEDTLFKAGFVIECERVCNRA